MNLQYGRASLSQQGGFGGNYLATVPLHYQKTLNQYQS